MREFEYPRAIRESGFWEASDQDQPKVSLVPDCQQMDSNRLLRWQRSVRLPPGADAWIMVCSPQEMAEFCPVEEWPLMNRALVGLLNRVTGALRLDHKDTREHGLRLYYDGLGPEFLQFDPRVVAFYEKQACPAGMKHIPVATHFGRNHRGGSAETSSMLSPEIPLDLYTALHGLFAHWRIVTAEDTNWWFDTPGTHYSYKKDGRYPDTTYIHVFNGNPYADWNFEERRRDHRAKGSFFELGDMPMP